jgi:hypothetical protein
MLRHRLGSHQKMVSAERIVVRKVAGSGLWCQYLVSSLMSATTASHCEGRSRCQGLDPGSKSGRSCQGSHATHRLSLSVTTAATLFKPQVQLLLPQIKHKHLLLEYQASLLFFSRLRQLQGLHPEGNETQLLLLLTFCVNRCAFQFASSVDTKVHVANLPFRRPIGPSHHDYPDFLTSSRGPALAVTSRTAHFAVVSDEAQPALELSIDCRLLSSRHR